MATAVRGKEPIAGRKISTFSPVAADTAHSRKSTTTNKKNAEQRTVLRQSSTDKSFHNFREFFQIFPSNTPPDRQFRFKDKRCR